MIIADNNVICYLLIKGKQSDAVERLREADPDWIAPRLWLDEYLNVLVTTERNGIIKPEDVSPMLVDGLKLMQGKDRPVDPERVLEVARKTGCSGYDSQYVALAEARGLKLYTFDKGILRRCPDIAIRPE